MMQGRANSSKVGSTKVEPTSQKVNPGGVSEIGAHVAKNPTPVFEGRGVKAPSGSMSIHHCGSQGKHK